MAEAAEVYRLQAAPGEVNEVLQKRLNAVVGTLNPDGSIHMAFVWFLFDGGRLYFETASVTRKARNAAERGVASMLIEGQTLMVLAEGKARVIDGDEAHRVHSRLRAKYVTETSREPVGRAFDTIDDVAVEITPAKWRSWSNRKLTQLIAEEHGRSGDDGSPADWHLPMDD